MDFNKIFSRVQAVLMTPKAQWPVIAEEPATEKDLYLNYIMILAALPPVFGFIKNSLIGHTVYVLGTTVHIQTPIGRGIGAMVLGWILALIGVYIVAWIISALASSFEGQPSRLQALKTVAYAYTASWIAGIAIIIPFIGWLIMIAGGIYSIYLLYLGLPHTMKCPPEKAVWYTVVTIVCAVVVSIIIGLIVVGVVGAGVYASGGGASVNMG